MIDDAGDPSGAAPTISVIAGNHSIAAPLTIAAGATINTAATTALSISGRIAGAGGITKTGTGSLVLSAAGNRFGDTTVQAGTFTLSSGASIAAGNLSVSAGAVANISGTLDANTVVTASGAVNFAGTAAGGGGAPPTQALSSLQINAGATVTVAASATATNPAVLAPASLTFAAGSARLNLTNNELITSAALPTVRSWIIAGQITGTTLPGKLAVGSLDLGGGQVEVRDTLVGDCNLDGKVDIMDVGLMGASFGATTGVVWSQGDFGYDGAQDLGDIGAMASNFGLSLATFNPIATPSASIAPVAGVPEPATIAVPIMVLAAVSRRCRQLRR
jgi:autotransporter-associated beta strand protein